MANILLVTQCNRSCPYCFAGSEMSGPAAGRRLTWENFIYIVDFLRASGQSLVSLLGGEPTIHPLCTDFILYLLDRGFSVTVFTNGMLSASRLDEFSHHLAKVSYERLNFVCNLNNPVQTPASPNETERIRNFLSILGPWTQPGFNIYREDFSLDFLFDLISRFGMKRNLRIGITHPIPGHEGSYIHTEDIRQVVQRLCSYRPLFETYHVHPRLDCGFPLCKFTDEELGWFQRFQGHTPFGCGAALDIAPDMSVYHCFPLYNYQRRSLFDFDSLEQIDKHFAQIRNEIQAEVAGIYEECDGCRCQENAVCNGGGLCRIVGRFINEAPVRLPGVEDGISQYRLPKQ